jgi:hypothetical protein
VADEHTLKEAPYIVMEPGRRAYGVQCACGWRSPLFDSEQEARDAASEHIANPPTPPPFLKKLFRRRRPFPGQYDRRR